MIAAEKKKKRGTANDIKGDRQYESAGTVCRGGGGEPQSVEEKEKGRNQKGRRLVSGSIRAKQRATIVRKTGTAT